MTQIHSFLIAAIQYIGVSRTWTVRHRLYVHLQSHTTTPEQYCHLYNIKHSSAICGLWNYVPSSVTGCVQYSECSILPGTILLDYFLFYAPFLNLVLCIYALFDILTFRVLLFTFNAALSQVYVYSILFQLHPKTWINSNVREVKIDILFGYYKSIIDHNLGSTVSRLLFNPSSKILLPLFIKHMGTSNTETIHSIKSQTESVSGE